MRENRLRINQEVKTIEQRRFSSPWLFESEKLIRSAVQRYVHGKVLDVGCGDMSYKNMLLRKADSYESFDVEKRRVKPTYLGDIQDMDMIPRDTYDTVICFYVLEHVPNPFKAVSELYRITKKGGIVLVTVPHLSGLHEEPNDFYRFTWHGVHFIFKNIGFTVIECTEIGGFMSFCGHQVSMLLLSATWHIPLVRQVMYLFNKWVLVYLFHVLDNIIGFKKVFPAGYLCIAKK